MLLLFLNIFKIYILANLYKLVLQKINSFHSEQKLETWPKKLKQILPI